MPVTPRTAAQAHLNEIHAKVDAEAAASQISCTVSEDVDSSGLVAWFGSNEGDIGQTNPAVFGDSMGRGLAASSNVQEGDRLCTIPFSLVVSSALAERTLGGGGQLQLPADLQLQPEVLLLAGFLMHERRNAQSKWTAWLDSLPALETFGSTFFWSDSELAELQNSQLGADTRRRRERVRHDFEILVPMLASTTIALQNEQVEKAESWNLWLWALSNVWSRSFYLELPDGEDQFSCSSVQRDAAGPRHGCLMLPYCDYINHNDRPTGFQVDYAATQITLQATQSYQAGEQVLDCYGPKPNATLLLNYGFCVPDNRHDSIVLCVKQPAAEPDTEPELVTTKSQLLTGHHLQETLHCAVTGTDLLPAELLAFMRIAHLESAAEAQSASGKLRGADRPFTLLNESRALKSLLRLAQGKLSQNSSTQAEDEHLLAQMDAETPIGDYRLYCAVVQRLSEKHILNRFCSALKTRMKETIMFFTMKNELTK